MVAEVPRMAFSFRVLAVCFLICQIDRVLCVSQEVILEIKDGDLNQVIFVGERDITLICHVSNTLHADVRISKIGGASVATNNAVGNCVEYNIQEVTEQDDGDYSCTARYEDENTGRIVEMSKLLSVKVRNTSRSVCLRNGSRLHEEYKEGDTLLLSCYCVDILGCIWSRTVVGSEIGESVPTIYTFEHNNKVLQQIVIGPLTSIDITVRYDCLHGSATKERCSIGPANVSINDSILPTILRSDH